MAKFCPIRNAKVVYLECLECEEKECQKFKKHVSNDSSVDTQVVQKGDATIPQTVPKS